MSSKNLNEKSFMIMAIGVSLFYLMYSYVYILEMKNIKEKNENKLLRSLFTVDGEKVTTLDIERIVAEFTNLYRPSSDISLNEDIISTIAINNFLEKYILLRIGESLKINVNDKEIENHYIKTKNSYLYEERFGFSKEEFKEEIKKKIIINKVINKFSKEGKEDQLLQEIYNIKKRMKIDNISPEIEDYIPRVVMSTQDIAITNFDIVNRMIILLHEANDNRIKTEDEYDLEKIKKKVEEKYKEDLLVIGIAKRVGIRVEEYLPVEKKIEVYTKELYRKIREDIVSNNEELKKYLESTKEK